MEINGRQITYKGNMEWSVDGQHAARAERGSDNLKVWGSMEIVEVTAEQARMINNEFEAAREARRQPVKPTRNSRQAKERAYDRGYNEGGEGYNPYRYGSARTYR